MNPKMVNREGEEVVNVQNKKMFKKIIQHILMITFTLIMIYPLLWMISSSFKESSTVFIDAHTLNPKAFKFSNYSIGWVGCAGISFSTFFINSVIIKIGRAHV